MSNGNIDLIIRGGKIVSPSSTIEADVAISGETIAAVTAPGMLAESAAEIDAKGRYILPGAIDSHVHFREPGYEFKEDWGTGTAAAACGGTTTVFEMPNTNPPTGTLQALQLKQERAAGAAS